METKAEIKRMTRTRRRARIRAKVSGTSSIPRFSVYKSNRYLHAQLIDDEAGKTVVSGSTKEMPKEKKMDGAIWLGKEIAARAKKAGISQVVFDRGGFRYTGRVSACAEAAREAGMKF